MVIVAVLVFPLPSSAVKVTVVAPSGNVSPGLWEVVSEPLPQLSATDGLTQFTSAVHTFGSVSTVRSLGRLVKVGSDSSDAVTCTVMVAEAATPQSSVTVKVTGLSPMSEQVNSV